MLPAIAANKISDRCATVECAIVDEVLQSFAMPTSVHGDTKHMYPQGEKKIFWRNLLG